MSSNPTLQNLTPQAAHHILQTDSRALLVDIRSTMEYLFVGHPTGSVHIPWTDEPGWTANPNFITDIRKLSLGGNSPTHHAHATQDAQCPPIILICRSGQRSQEAGCALIEAGLKNIHHIDEGFEGNLNDQHQRSTLNGWRYADLPWEQC